MKPNIQRRVENKQLAQKINHDTSTSTRTFVTNDPVLIKNFNNTGPKWLQGHIIQPVGPLSYLVKLTDGRIFRRHVDITYRKVPSHQTLFLVLYLKIILMLCFQIKLHRTVMILVGTLSEIDGLQKGTDLEV